MKTIRPSEGYYIVKASKADDRTPGGIIMPNTVRNENYITGKVMAVGNGMWLEGSAGLRRTPQFECGETVMFRAGEEIYSGGEKVQLVHESGIVGAVED